MARSVAGLLADAAIVVVLATYFPRIRTALYRLAAGAGTSFVACTVSVGLATLGFFVGYRVLEDYVLLPKVVGRAVRMPALVTVVAVLLGFQLPGVVGAFVAVPVAAAVLLVVREVAEIGRAHV